MQPAQAKALTDAIARWVETRSDLKSLALVGSWAHSAARPDSDIDLLVLADDSNVYRAERDWLAHVLPPSFRVLSERIVDYGAVWSCHALLAPDAELEISFGPLAWAKTDPIDPGTLRVVRDGFRIILDKDGHLQRLRDAVDSRPTGS